MVSMFVSGGGISHSEWNASNDEALHLRNPRPNGLIGRTPAKGGSLPRPYESAIETGARGKMDFKTPALTLYVVSMLLWCVLPEEAQAAPTIQGLSYSVIQANSYPSGTSVDVTVDSTVGAGYVCRWTSL